MRFDKVMGSSHLSEDDPVFARSLLLVALFPLHAFAEEPSAKVVPFLAYDRAIEMKLGTARAVIGPQAGGRVLEFSIDGKHAMYLDPNEKNYTPGKPASISAGRFDYGPELTVIAHPKIWSGDWTAEIVGTKVKLTSPQDGGMQLVREFSFTTHEKSVGLACKQSMVNISKETREVCHWGRSFSPGGGICLIPLGDKPSRFPSKYAMYEDLAIINVRNADDKIRERWLPGNSRAAAKAQARLRHLRRLARLRAAERHAVREEVRHASGSRLQRSRWPHAFRLVSNGPAHRVGTDRPPRAPQARRIGLVHRGVVASCSSLSQARRTTRPEEIRRAGRQGNRRIEVS